MLNACNTIKGGQRCWWANKFGKLASFSQINLLISRERPGYLASLTLGRAISCSFISQVRWENLAELVGDSGMCAAQVLFVLEETWRVISKLELPRASPHNRFGCATPLEYWLLFGNALKQPELGYCITQIKVFKVCPIYSQYWLTWFWSKQPFDWLSCLLRRIKCF